MKQALHAARCARFAVLRCLAAVAFFKFHCNVNYRAQAIACEMLFLLTLFVLIVFTTFVGIAINYRNETFRHSTR